MQAWNVGLDRLFWRFNSSPRLRICHFSCELYHIPHQIYASHMFFSISVNRNFRVQIALKSNDGLFCMIILIMIFVSVSWLERFFFFLFSLCWLWIFKDIGQVPGAVHTFLLQVFILKIFKGDIGNGTNIQLTAEIPVSMKLTNSKKKREGAENQCF